MRKPAGHGPSYQKKACISSVFPLSLPSACILPGPVPFTKPSQAPWTSLSLTATDPVRPVLLPKRSLDLLLSLRRSYCAQIETLIISCLGHYHKTHTLHDQIGSPLLFTSQIRTLLQLGKNHSFLVTFSHHSSSICSSHTPRTRDSRLVTGTYSE